MSPNTTSWAASLLRAKIESVKPTLLAAAVLIGFLAGCSKDINNKEALHAALVDYYNSNQDKMGLSMNTMDIEIGSMTFQKEQAEAQISIKPKAGGEGMQMSKVFDRKGDKWVVRAGSAAGAGHGGGMAMPPGEGGMPSGAGGPLPPGHPPTGGAVTPARPLPAGHPPVGESPKS